MPFVKSDRTAEVLRAIKALTTARVLVGVPAEGAARAAEPDAKGATPNNAALAYMHNYGVPENNEPARPFMEPGIEAAKPEIVKRLKKAGMAALSGDLSEIDKGMHAVGLVAQGKMQGIIQAGIAPPLSERTVNTRLRRKKGRRSPGPMTPLIDTAAMLKSITYVVRK